MRRLTRLRPSRSGPSWAQHLAETGRDVARVSPGVDTRSRTVSGDATLRRSSRVIDRAPAFTATWPVDEPAGVVQVYRSVPAWPSRRSTATIATDRQEPAPGGRREESDTDCTASGGVGPPPERACTTKKLPTAARRNTTVSDIHRRAGDRRGLVVRTPTGEERGITPVGGGSCSVTVGPPAGAARLRVLDIAPTSSTVPSKIAGNDAPSSTGMPAAMKEDVATRASNPPPAASGATSPTPPCRDAARSRRRSPDGGWHLSRGPTAASRRSPGRGPSAGCWAPEDARRHGPPARRGGCRDPGRATALRAARKR